MVLPGIRIAPPPLSDSARMEDADAARRVLGRSVGEEKRLLQTSSSERDLPLPLAALLAILAISQLLLLGLLTTDPMSHHDFLMILDDATGIE